MPRAEPQWPRGGNGRAGIRVDRRVETEAGGLRTAGRAPSQCQEQEDHATRVPPRRSRKLSTEFAKTPVIVLADTNELTQIMKALEYGARRLHSVFCWHRRLRRGHQASACRRHLRAGKQRVRNAPDCSNSGGEAGRPVNSMFTDRQAEVVEALRRGKPNKIIAYELNLRESTVKVHIRNIMKKIKATNRTEVVYKINDLFLRELLGFSAMDRACRRAAVGSSQLLLPRLPHSAAAERSGDQVRSPERPLQASSARSEYRWRTTWSGISGVMLRALRERASVALADLPQPGQSGTHVEVGGPWIVLPLLGHHRTRADKAHVAYKHIEELRQLVDRVFAEIPAQSGDARIFPEFLGAIPFDARCRRSRSDMPPGAARRSEPWSEASRG